MALFKSTSTTSLTIGTGSKAFATQSGKAWTPGLYVIASSDTDPASYMHGQVTAYSGGTLTVNVASVGGAGTFNDWTISLSGTRGATGAAGASGAQGDPGDPTDEPVLVALAAVMSSTATAAAQRAALELGDAATKNVAAGGSGDLLREDGGISGTSGTNADIDAAIAAAGDSETGDLTTSFRTSKTGWVLADGRTVGNAASGGTSRANADTEALFTLLWNNLADSEAPVSGGRGASAAADFAANKTITLPDIRGRVVAGRDDMGGTAANRLTSGGSGIVGATLGKAGGTQTHTLTTTEMPSHAHSFSVGTNQEVGGFPIAGGDLSGSQGTASAGSGGAHQNTQPTIVANVFIKI